MPRDKGQCHNVNAGVVDLGAQGAQQLHTQYLMDFHKRIERKGILKIGQHLTELGK